MRDAKATVFYTTATISSRILGCIQNSIMTKLTRCSLGMEQRWREIS